MIGSSYNIEMDDYSLRQHLEWLERETDNTLDELQDLMYHLSAPVRDASPPTFNEGLHELEGDAVLDEDSTDSDLTSSLPHAPTDQAVTSTSIADQNVRMDRCDILALELPTAVQVSHYAPTSFDDHHVTTPCVTMGDTSATATMCKVTTKATTCDTSSSWPADLKLLEDDSSYPRLEKCARKEGGASWSPYGQDAFDFDKSYVQGCCLKGQGGRETWSPFHTKKAHNVEVPDYQRGMPFCFCYDPAWYGPREDGRSSCSHKSRCDYLMRPLLEYQAMIYSYAKIPQPLCEGPSDIYGARQLKRECGTPQEPPTYVGDSPSKTLQKYGSGVNQYDLQWMPRSGLTASKMEPWKNYVDSLSICPPAALLPLLALQMYDNEADDVDDSPSLGQQVLLC